MPQFKPPSADILSWEEARSLYIEMLGGNPEPEELPPGLRCLCIVDTGCGTSMGNCKKTQYKPGSMYREESAVIAAGGNLGLNEKGEMRYPLATSRGPGYWGEHGSIFNQACPYVLLALGRASIEKGVTLVMPPWGADGHFEYPNGVRVTFHNRFVLVVRPIGYKLNPDKAIALFSVTIESLGVPSEGAFGFYLGAGEDRPHNLERQLSSDTFCMVPIDECRNSAHDIANPAVASALITAASLNRCLLVYASINCNTYTVLHYREDAQGRPGKPLRGTDNVLGYLLPDGTRPASVVKSNNTTRVTAEVLLACAAHGGAIAAETPKHRRPGTPDAMPGCELHVNNFDHPSFILVAESVSAVRLTVDLCRFLDRPEDATQTGPKATEIMMSPNLYEEAQRQFGGKRCDHPHGTHRAIRGVDADGVYLSVGTQRYPVPFCGAVAAVFKWFLSLRG